MCSGEGGGDDDDDLVAFRVPPPPNEASRRHSAFELTFGLGAEGGQANWEKKNAVARKVSKLNKNLGTQMIEGAGC